MKAFVNSDCIGCGLCAQSCPEVFSMGEDGLAVASAEVTADNVSCATEAKDGCPVNAIEIE